MAVSRTSSRTPPLCSMVRAEAVLPWVQVSSTRFSPRPACLQEDVVQPVPQVDGTQVGVALDDPPVGRGHAPLAERDGRVRLPAKLIDPGREDVGVAEVPGRGCPQTTAVLVGVRTELVACGEPGGVQVGGGCDQFGHGATIYDTAAPAGQPAARTGSVDSSSSWRSWAMRFSRSASISVRMRRAAVRRSATSVPARA
jgi:hypothetical protein